MSRLASRSAPWLGVVGLGVAGLGVAGLGSLGCESSPVLDVDASASPPDAGMDASIDAFVAPIDATRDAPIDFSRVIDALAFEYDWSCGAEVAPVLEAPSAEPPVEDCSAGIWPDLPITAVCPTVSAATRTDPDTGATLPPEDTRTLPVTIPVSESGSFLPDGLPSTWPTTVRVVEWNMEYTRNLDDQIETLLNDPELSRADVFLLSELDRCSQRNGVRHAARLLAQRIEGAYVYGIEFVELSIGRTIGGDTGNAIVSRRPLTGATLLCQSSQFDWLADEEEPRLGQRIVLSAEIPAGDTFVRVHSVHYESNDVTGERRTVQVKETLDHAQASACERPQIIAGDFNTWYPRAPERFVMQRAGWTDAMEAVGDIGPTHESGRRLDYIYTRGFRVVAGAVLREVRTSDHSPLWVDLTLE
ncbi:MAG: endonuclease/exonuclease/phosphatase family protein [Deltaproteobacteria bacterium]|jgi:endonuclease/exonuclease/phosphatase family metal-dependent hydrolase